MDNTRGVYSEFRGNTEIAMIPDTVESFHCASRKSNAPNVFRSGVAGTRLYAAQVGYVNSSTESTVLPSTIIGDGVDPEPNF